MWCALSLCWRVQQLMVFRICVCLWEAGSGLILLIYEAFKKKMLEKKNLPVRNPDEAFWRG